MRHRRLPALICALLCCIALQMRADKPTYALVNISAANVRQTPSHTAELVTQQLMGWPVKLLESSNGWSKVETVDGYTGYIIDNSLIGLDDRLYARWRQTPRVVYVCVDETKVMPEDATSDEPVSDLVPGAILEVTGPAVDGEDIIVALPDGRRGIIDAGCAMGIDDWAAQPFDVQIPIEYARWQMGTPYLWGGTSAKGMDCSGLTWVGYALDGRILPRDASAQARVGRKVADAVALVPGDLIFFGNPSNGRINHVGLVETSDHRMIHSSGRVKRNGFATDAPNPHKGSFIHGISLADYPNISSTPAQKAWFFLEN